MPYSYRDAPVPSNQMRDPIGRSPGHLPEGIDVLAAKAPGLPLLPH